MTQQKSTITQLIKQLKDFKEHLIKSKVAEGLITQNPRKPRFYTKPKIHKEGIPQRTVISSVNCHNSKISEYIDYHQQMRRSPEKSPLTFYTRNFFRKLKPIT